MSYFQLSLKYKRILSLGLLLTFFSGYGQTFFISTFTPKLIETFGIGNSTFGFIYALATIASGALIPFLGGRLDHVDPIRYTRVVILGLAVSGLIVGSSQILWLSAFGIFGLRLFGQGLFSHVSSTVIAKSFVFYRGRALSLSEIGHPLGEAFLPIVSVGLVSLIGWRWSWAVLSAILLIVLLPGLNYLFAGDVENREGREAKPAEKEKRLPFFIRHFRFWYFSLGAMIPGFILTALFLYHGWLAQVRGWSLAWIATCFVGFAAARLFFSLIGGLWIDRKGALALFPLALLPLALGLGVLSLDSSSLWIAPLYLVLSGISVGVFGPMKTAVWAEIYGTRQLAQIRSWTASLGVFSTALGPAFLGWALDANLSLEVLLRFAVGLILVYSIFSFLLGVPRR